MKKLIIFGCGAIAELANYYFQHDSVYDVVAFTVDKDYCLEDTFQNKPLVSFQSIIEKYPPADHELFIALSYTKMNTLRAQKFFDGKEMGYQIASYISSKCTYLSDFEPGANAFILEDNTIQPFVKIGDNVTLWSGNHIGHHSTIHAHTFVSSHVVISGNCEIGSFCFLGVNSTIANNVKLAERTLIGAGAIINKSTDVGGVYVAAKPTKLKLTSDKINL